MQADFSVELGGDASALEIPWRSDDPYVRYFDLKIHPELVLQIPEAVAYPELATFSLALTPLDFRWRLPNATHGQAGTTHCLETMHHNWQSPAEVQWDECMTETWQAVR